MRRRLRQWVVLCGVLLLGRAPEAKAKVYLTRDEALRLAFGSTVTIVEDQRQITPALRTTIERQLGRPLSEERFTFYVGQDGGQAQGYAVVLDEMGKHEPITFVVAIQPDGHVKDVMILEYRESRGGEVRQKGFLRQYAGKSTADPLELGEDITPMTGSTISARAISDGVKKALVVWEALYTGRE